MGMHGTLAHLSRGLFRPAHSEECAGGGEFSPAEFAGPVKQYFFVIVTCRYRGTVQQAPRTLNPRSGAV